MYDAGSVAQEGRRQKRQRAVFRAVHRQFAAKALSALYHQFCHIFSTLSYKKHNRGIKFPCNLSYAGTCFWVQDRVYFFCFRTRVITR